MHLGDMGTEVYLQELNATLLENEEYLRGEVMAAMERIDEGTYGTCENCGTKIIEERLELLPYARYCTPCAEKLQSGKDINLNEGRPRDAADTYNPYDDRAASGVQGDRLHQSGYRHRRGLRSRRRPAEPGRHPRGRDRRRRHGRGRPGRHEHREGDPNNADLEDAMGSGTHDVAIEADDEDTVAYSGPSGGAVGGTPAGKRAVGGKKRRGGIVPSEDPDRPNRGETHAVGRIESRTPSQDGNLPNPSNHE